MRRWITWVLSILFTLIVTHNAPIFAKENTDAKTNDVKKGISTYTPESKFSFNKSRATEVIFSKCSTINDKEIKFACKKSYLKEFSNYEFELGHREDVLKWQHLSTKIILLVVLILVSLGLYFAWVQFHSTDSNNEISELEVSMSGVKISSPVLGVIILTLSLVFLASFICQLTLSMGKKVPPWHIMRL